MGHAHKRPQHIEEARLSGNFDILSAGGQKAAQTRRENAEKRAAEEAKALEQAQVEDEMLDRVRTRDQIRDELTRRYQTNDHIYPPETYD